MPDPQGSAAAPGPSLFASLRSFWSVLLAILYTRLDLVTTELEDGGVRAVKLLVAGLVGVVLSVTAFFFAMVFLIALAWYTPYRLWVIGGICLVYLLGGLISFAIARTMFLTRPKFLSQTIAELRRDVEGLNRLIKKDEEAGS
jgi:uncharacterized membrane protein YqjE